MQRFPDFKDGSFVSLPLALERDDNRELLERSLNASSIEDALSSALELPERDYLDRLNALHDIVGRFEDIYPELRTALLEAMDENALNLAAKTLPEDKVAEVVQGATIPLDDVSFAHPPTLEEAFEVAKCWDTTKNPAVYSSAVAMFDELDGQVVTQDLEALQKAHETGEPFMHVLHRDVVQSDIRNTGYYKKFESIDY